MIRFSSSVDTVRIVYGELNLPLLLHSATRSQSDKSGLITAFRSDIPAKTGSFILPNEDFKLGWWLTGWWLTTHGSARMQLTPHAQRRHTQRRQADEGQRRHGSSPLTTRPSRLTRASTRSGTERDHTRRLSSTCGHTSRGTTAVLHHSPFKFQRPASQFHLLVIRTSSAYTGHSD